MRRAILGGGLLLMLANPAAAGLYYSGETFAELPARWPGFLLDQQALRRVAVPPRPGIPPNPRRDQYVDALTGLETLATRRPLTADERADQGALLVRLGRYDEAVQQLRAAQREHPDHFAIAANLGTAWQLAGHLDQSALALTTAVRRAPPDARSAEDLHLRLVRDRQRSPAGSLDRLWDVTYAPAQPATVRAKLPANALALLQRLALTLPDDARLLWQLGELAAAGGDVETALRLLDACVGEFGLSDPLLRQHRRQLQQLSERSAEHADHKPWSFRSPRPLTRLLDPSLLPPIRPEGVNDVPWPLLAQTRLSRTGAPTFPDYLRQLDGRRVQLVGFMRPLGEEWNPTVFLLVEFPIGCWFCETPDPRGLVIVEMRADQKQDARRGLVKVEGVLKLNRNDPEDFLFAITSASAAEPD